MDESITQRLSRFFIPLFADLLQWWKRRRSSENAWKLTFKPLAALSFNLDQRHPSESDELVLDSPAQLLTGIREKENRIQSLLDRLLREIEAVQ